MISATVNISGSFLDSYESGAINSFKKSFLSSAETLTGAVIIKAVGGRVAATCCIGAGDKNVKVEALDGTSTYTLLMWQAD